MKRAVFLLTAILVAGCSYIPTPATSTPEPASTKPASAPAKIASASSLIGAMHDRYGGKYFKTMTFLQNNTAYTTTGEEQKSQWYVHIQAPGKMRIAFLPAAQRSGLVQVNDKVASFDNGIRVDFRPSVYPALLLTVDVHSAAKASILRDLDSLGVKTEIIRSDEWEGRPVYVVGAKAGDTTSNQMWVDAEHLQLVRFIQRDRRGNRVFVSDTRVRGYREIEGFRVPTEILVVRNGRPAWREERTDIRINAELPPEVFDQALWHEIPAAR